MDTDEILDIRIAWKPRTTTIKTTAPQVKHSVTAEVIKPKPKDVDQSTKTHLLTQDHDWNWEQLRDYVISKIIELHGPIPRDGKKERGIFSSFLGRWEGRASAIARYAMEERAGFWKGSPVGVNRFCKNSDPYFAEPIVKILS